MGIFKRTKDIITANINSLLDQAENPESMINQIVRELEVTISDLKCSCANKLAERKTLERKVKDVGEEIKRWAERAEMAVKNGKDNLAKEALREKGIKQAAVDQFKKDLERVDIDVESCKEQVLKLEEKLVDMVNRKKELISRAVRAHERNQANDVMSKASGADIIEKFSRYESKIERMEAESEIFSSTMENEFEVMESDKKIEDELNELKAKLKGKDK